MKSWNLNFLEQQDCFTFTTVYFLSFLFHVYEASVLSLPLRVALLIEMFHVFTQCF